MGLAFTALFLVFLLMVLVPLIIGSFIEKYGDWRDDE